MTDNAALVLLREQVELTLEQAKAVRAGMDELIELLRHVGRGAADLHAELRRARRDLDRHLDGANRRARDRY